MLEIIISLLTYLGSFGYVLFYQETRKVEKKITAKGVFLSNKILPGFLLNFVICFIFEHFGFGADDILIILLIVIMDIDLLIYKIPTELLVVCGLITLSDIVFYRFLLLSIVTALLIGGAMFYFRKKIGIALYDIILIVILAMQIYYIDDQLVFAAFVLIFWGLTGYLLKEIIKINDIEKIPMVPVIVLAFTAASMI